MTLNKRWVSVRIDEGEMMLRNRELSVLLEMSNAQATSMNVKGLLSEALSIVVKYFDFDAGRIYLTEEGGQYLYLAAHIGVKPLGLGRVSINEGFSGKAVRTKSFITEYVSELEDKKRVALLSSKGFKTIICTPLITMDKVVGVMNLATSKMIRLDEKDIDLITTIGNQIAVALNYVRYYDDLEKRIKTLNEKNEMIKFITCSVTHDLKSPAVGIYGLTKRLEEKYSKILDEKGKAYCDQILKTSKQMLTLVKNINEYITMREISLTLEKVKVKEITDTIRGEFSFVLNERHICWSEPETLPEIIADRLALLRVFQNFVENSLKYGGEEMSEIKIGYEESEAYHILSFYDNGIGIKAADAEKIFEVFQRHETAQGTTGSGLGLAIVKEIAKSHHGEVWLDNRVERGVTFYISIPKGLNILN